MFRGGIVGLLGTNGSGKSTLLKAVLDLVPRRGGAITLDGEPIDDVGGRIAFYAPAQRGRLGLPITVEEVVVLGRQAGRGLLWRPGRSDWQIGRDALERLGISELRRRQIGELSGGQQQRVFLARALAQEGDVLLLDEPLTGVDAQTQGVVLELVANLRRDGQAIVMTTHDLVQAAELCDRVYLLNGRVVASGVPAHVLTPRALVETCGGREVLRVIEGVGLVGLPHGAGADSHAHHEAETRSAR